MSKELDDKPKKGVNTEKDNDTVDIEAKGVIALDDEELEGIAGGKVVFSHFKK